MATSRNASMDFLRIICAIFIVFIHVTPDYIPGNEKTLSSLFIHPLVRSALPIFFMISGYFILNNKNSDSILVFYKKRLLSILIPFLVFSFIHYTYYHQWDPDAYSGKWLLNYFKAILIGAPNNFAKDYFMTALYWFVYAITGLYLLSPAIKKSISFINNENALKYTLCTIAGYFAYSELMMAHSAIGYSENLFFMPEGIKWMFYFICGGMIFRIKKQKIAKLAPYSAVFFYLLVIVTYYCSFNGYWFSQGWIDANPAMAGLAISLFFIAHFYNVSIQSKWLAEISGATYGVYLIHIVLLSPVNNYTQALKDHVLIYTLITGFAVFIFSLIISFVINKSIIQWIDRALK